MKYLFFFTALISLFFLSTSCGSIGEPSSSVEAESLLEETQISFDVLTSGHNQNSNPVVFDIVSPGHGIELIFYRTSGDGSIYQERTNTFFAMDSLSIEFSFYEAICPSKGGKIDIALIIDGVFVRKFFADPLPHQFLLQRENFKIS